ncbi:methyltransferase [Mucilaginibacter koreensis]
MGDIFRFKQFAVNQTGCAMKVNTDGVLLGALVGNEQPSTILDIGTGTGVIALMLAQRFPEATIDAVEIDELAAQTAYQNFAHSPYAERLQLHPGDYQIYLNQHPDKEYDLIVSNPPFYIQSLKSPHTQKSVAKHADEQFFFTLIQQVVSHLSDEGQCWLILPVNTAALVKELSSGVQLYLQHSVLIGSYPDSIPHREVLALGKRRGEIITEDLHIYNEPKVYSQLYQTLLKNFLTIF